MTDHAVRLLVVVTVLSYRQIKPTPIVAAMPGGMWIRVKF